MDIVIGKGPTAKSLRLKLPAFTLIGATTRFAQLSSPRVTVSVPSIAWIFMMCLPCMLSLKRSACILGVEAEDDGLQEIACRARGTPRVANRLLKQWRDYAQVKANGAITREIALAALVTAGG